MGYVNNLEKLISGDITGLEPEFRAEEMPQISIRGYDRRHRLMRGVKSRSFTQVKDSDLAGQIANDAGLTTTTAIVSIADCDEVAGALDGGLDADFTVTAAVIAPEGTAVTCTVALTADATVTQTFQAHAAAP